MATKKKLSEYTHKELGLTLMQWEFVKIRVSSGANVSSTKCAEEAGYAGGENAAAVAASRMLKNPKILRALQLFQTECSDGTIAKNARILTRQKALERLSTLAMESDPANSIKAIDLLGRYQSWQRQDDQAGLTIVLNTDATKALEGPNAPAKQEPLVVPCEVVTP